PMPLMDTQVQSEQTELVHRGVPDLRGSGLRLFGWVVLILLLLAGGGAVFLALDSERSGAAPPAPPPEPQPAGAAAPVGAEAAAGGAAAGKASATGRERGRERAGGRGERGDREGREERGEARRHDREERPSAAEVPAGEPRDAKEAQALLDEARSLRDNLEWEKARALYQRVVQGKFHRSAGYLGLAEVAFQTKRLDDVIAYAKRAGTGIRARVLLGHAYYQKGNYETALRYYESVLKQDKNHTEAQHAAKAAREKLGKK